MSYIEVWASDANENVEAGLLKFYELMDTY